MPKYNVVVDCCGPIGDAALTYRNILAATPAAAEAIACRKVGEYYTEYPEILGTRTERVGN